MRGSWTRSRRLSRARSRWASPRVGARVRRLGRGAVGLSVSAGSAAGLGGIRTRAFLGVTGADDARGGLDLAGAVPCRGCRCLRRLGAGAPPRGMVALDRDPPGMRSRCAGASRLGRRTGLGRGAGLPQRRAGSGDLGSGLDPGPRIPYPARPRLRGPGPVGIGPVRGLTLSSAGGKILRKLAQGALEALAQALQVKRRRIRPGLRGQRLSLCP